ncbi:serine/threonine protein phosphatase family protein [Oceaniovalibus guishaninsula JLT2003]|uniref:Serine/threonine protein phosphatase family protein n=1 Tax=Oceaniovalibus guishaninsula JLT2003 TaxID=1231392 RepID=K2I4Z1_9RHOB|nr:metallophosphoesterase [Oceaniovalibus guishaninsula]EKE43995.1 serine/threonine protein phosphatase family protein [Oceaniovalibus guishaninsula JLT2003]
MIYAIGDIHGQAAALDRALALIETDGGPDAPVVFLGDYTDRGPDSRGVLDRLIDGRDAGRPWRFVMGNHDRMFLRFVTDGAQNDDRIKSGLSWMNRRLGGTTTLASYGLRSREGAAFLHTNNGGRETLSSYDIDGRRLGPQELVIAAREAVPEAHIQFLATLDLWVADGPLLFVHAGLRPGIPIERQDPDDLLWIRQGWLEDTRDHGPLVVHGHTALDHPRHYGNRVNLDGGAGYGNPLVPVVFEGRESWTLTPRGRVPLRPD